MNRLAAARVGLLARARVPALALAACAFATPVSSQDEPDEAAPVPAPPSVTSSPRTVLRRLRELESANDPKCHSTACRFEDFVYGTPLTEAGRAAKVGLQKELVTMLWRRASVATLAAGERNVKPARLRPVIAGLYERVTDEAGDLRVTFPGRGELVVEAVRARQYGSIAFSLRAILAAQQDFLFGGGPVLVTLGPRSVDALREAVDTVTLCALARANEAARLASVAELDVAAITAAWRSLVPAPEPLEGAATIAPSAGARAVGAELVQGIIDEKAAAYRAYNDVEGETVFLSNFIRFYALYPLPEDGSGGAFLGAYDARVVAFTAELLARAGRVASAASSPVVRAPHASRAVHALLPHRIDDFEDVELFFRVPREAVVLESYDCDSYRDFGRHWEYFRRALEVEAAAAVPLDPFASEIVAEAISQYGVALLRLAGAAALERLDAPHLTRTDLADGNAAFERLVEAHHAAPVEGASAVGIVSAGGVSASAASGAWFADVTATSGITFVHRSSRWLSEFRRASEQNPPTFSGGGVAAEDLDADGDHDVVFVGGGGNAVYANDGAGRFVEADAGVDWRRADGYAGEARQPLTADFDGDGAPDLLVTYAHDEHRLYRNAGELRFDDRTADAGLGGAGRVGGPATAFDFDRDGRLDVYVGYFGPYLDGAVPLVGRHSANAGPNALLRNEDGLRFRDVAAASGTADTGWTQALAHTDLDGDGWQDLIVANDYGRNRLYRNRGDGTFEDLAPALGMTKAYHSMNVGLADLNADGFPEVFVSNIATMVKDNKYAFPDVETPQKLGLRELAGMLVKESSVLYASRAEEGRLAAYAPSDDVERGESSTGWAWDAEFCDFDHDGDDDLYLVNGTNDYAYFFSITALEDEETRHLYLSHARQPNVFFVNEGGKLRNRSSASGAGFRGNSRSAAYLDLEGDGDLDVVVANFHGPATVLRNDVGAASGGWLTLRLVGDPARGVTTGAVGARMIVTTADGVRLVREVQVGSGYLSCEPSERHFGLAGAERADVEILWPNGERQVFEGLEAGGRYTVPQAGAPARR